MLEKRVPWGKIEVHTSTDMSSYLRWAPGDATAYDAVVCYVGWGAEGCIGGDWMVSVRIRDKWRSVPLSFEGMGMIHSSVLEEHLLLDENERMSGTLLYSILIYTIMLNYSLFDNDMAREYVNELKQHPWLKSRFGF